MIGAKVSSTIKEIFSLFCLFLPMMKVALFLCVLVAGCFGQGITCDAAEELTNGVQVKGNNLLGERYDQACGEITIDNVVYYKYTKIGPAEWPVTITLCGEETNFATSLFVRQICGDENHECNAFPVNGFCGEQSVITVDFVAPGESFIIGVGSAMDDWFKSETTGEFQIKVYESEPVSAFDVIPIFEGKAKSTFGFYAQDFPPVCGYNTFQDAVLFQYQTMYSGSEITFSSCADYYVKDMFILTDIDNEEPTCVDFQINAELILKKDHDEDNFCAEITVSGFNAGETLYVLMSSFSSFFDGEQPVRKSSISTRGTVIFPGDCGIINVLEDDLFFDQAALKDSKHSDVSSRGEIFEITCPAFLEVREPPLNDLCENAISIQNNEVVSGTLRGATAQSSSCTGSGLSSGQMVYYSYTSSTEGASALTFVCTPNDLEIGIEIHVFSSCDLTECVERVLSCVDSPGVEVEAGTELVIGVTSQGFAEGMFSFEVRESLLRFCNPDGPEYECATSFEIETDHMCDGVQCATITEEDLYLGYCFDYSGCDCTITRVTGLELENEPYVTVGMELTSALPHYPVYSIATNDEGVSTDLCSFRININDKCNVNGPRIIPREQPVYISTRSSCITESGERCGVIPPFFPGTCSDNKNCSCEVYLISTEYATGNKLTAGTYTASIGARNELGFESEPVEVTFVVA